MVDFNVNIKVDNRKAKANIANVNKQLKQTEKQSKVVGAGLKSAFAGVGILLAVRSLQRLADTFTNIQNRLRVVTTTTAQLNKATSELFAIANRTRSSFEATAEIYSRVGLATKNLGIDQKQTLQFTESLNQAVILSGASAQEAQAGLIQLGQGLASGALRGDELRSVLEQLPVVADVIAKSMNITRGELRILGSEGKISAEIVLNAFKEAREELAERFAKSVPTIAQAFTILSNNVILFVGQLNEATGASRIIIQVIIALATNLEVIGLALLVVAAGFTALKLPAIIAGFQLLAGSTTLFSTALAFLVANPIVLFVSGLTAIVILIVRFQEQILAAVNSVPILSFALTFLANIFKFLLAGGIAVVLGAMEAFRIIIVETAATFTAFGEIVQPIVQAIVGFFVNLGNIVTAVVSTFNEFIGQFVFLAKVVEEITKVVSTFFKKLTAAFKKVIAIADRFIAKIVGIKEEMEETAEVSNTAAASITKDFKREKDAADTTSRGIKNAFRGLGGAISEPIVSGVAIGIAEFSKLANAAQNASSKIKSQSFSPSGGGGVSSGGGGSKGGPFGTGQAGTGAKFFTKLGNKFSQTGKIAELGGGGSGFNLSGKVFRNFSSGIRGDPSAQANLDANDQFEKALTTANKRGVNRGSSLSGISDEEKRALAASFGLQFQRGGSLTVGGSGGPDSQTLPVNLTPGEKLTVTTAKQDRQQSEVAGQGDKRPIQINFNIIAEDADSFKLSQKQIISTVATEIQRITEGE